MKEHLRLFFENYARLFNAALRSAKSGEGTSGFFSDCFLATSPQGVMCGNNNEKFKAAIEKGYAFYRQIGVTAMNIVEEEISELNDLHQMTKVRWRCDYARPGGPSGSVEFDNIYFTRVDSGHLSIFAYITGDEQAALKQCGLI